MLSIKRQVLSLSAVFVPVEGRLSLPRTWDEQPSNPYICKASPWMRDIPLFLSSSTSPRTYVTGRNFNAIRSAGQQALDTGSTHSLKLTPWTEKKCVEKIMEKIFIYEKCLIAKILWKMGKSRFILKMSSHIDLFKHIHLKGKQVLCLISCSASQKLP